MWSNKQKKTKIKQKTSEKTRSKPLRLGLFLKVIAISTIAFLLWRGWDYTKPSNFPIKRVKIVASYEHIDRESLQNVIASYVSNGFFYLNVIGMKRQLLKLPWVYAAWVQREWPDTVIVNVIEQQAVLQWGTKALVNSKGEIFTPPISTFPKGLSTIFSPEGLELEVFSLYQKVQQQFAILNLAVKSLVFNPQHYWEILLSNNTIVYVKENDPLNQLKLLINLYRKITAGHKEPPKSIDLRYNTSGLAVKWK